MAIKIVYQGPNGAIALDEQQNTTVSSNYTVQPSDYIITATGAGGFTITLPPAGPSNGKNILIKCLTTASITVSAQVGEFIDSSPSRVLTNGEVLDIISDGTKWVDTIGTSISGSKIIDGTVTDTKLSSNAVTEAKIASNAVTEAKIANNAVTAAKIATGAVGNDEINTSSSPTVNTIYTNNWFRSNGATGWYNQTHGGGIFMEDSNYVKIYNNKAFMPSAGSGTNGIIFPANPGGGGGDVAYFKYYPYSGESCVLDIGIANDAGDYIKISAPSGTISISSRLTLSSCGSRGTTGYAITTPNDSVANATRYSGYIEWSTDVGLVGTNYFLSDIRKKEHIRHSTFNCSEIIKKFDFIEFDWKPESGGEGHADVGVSAQQIENIDSRLIRKLSDGTLMIHEPTFNTYVAKALQEQIQITEKQNQQIQSLEERIKKLEELIKS